jgi:preprotein translocase subunit SecA
MVQHIRRTSDGLANETDASLRRRTDRLRQSPVDGDPESCSEHIAQAFSLVAEAARRTLNISLYDVQLLAGLALVRGAIAEMQTGEGKTLAAALPAVSAALRGRGVHVMTVNRYLAQRDYHWLAPLFARLGVSAGLLEEGASSAEKRRAYACDITYGPGYEFGFDYLRDQTALHAQRSPRLGDMFRQRLRAAGQQASASNTVQRGHVWAVIDEVDSVLIDEATTPLVLSDGPARPNPDQHFYVAAAQIAEQLQSGEDFRLDTRSKQIQLSRQGTDKVLARLPRAKVGEAGPKRPWPQYIEQALRAKLVLKNDVDYLIRDQEIRLVDESTGRVFSDRTWNDGLHQAVQVKEGVPVTAEQRPLARISRQQYFRRYEHLCGMTGTATGCEREFWTFYRLPVVVVPLRTPCRRKYLPSRFFCSAQAKWRVIGHVVQEIHATDQPILVGTRTIEDSQTVAQWLDDARVPYRMLNGKQDAQEADIVARAGEVGAVTIATNMAGRGTDIRLAPGAVRLGGLHVIATEPHDSSRVDRQLFGRSARQGDEGSCQLFVSADDRLVRDHAPWMRRRMVRWSNEQGEVRANLSRALVSLQRRVERLHYARRCELFAQDQWLEDLLSKLAP